MIPVTPCHCADPGCPAHPATSTCPRSAAKSRGGRIICRIDMDDRFGTKVCRACAEDAMDSGVFR